MNFYSCGSSPHDKYNKLTVVSISESHGLPVLCWDYLQEVVFENNPSDHETWSIWCHVGIHVDFTSILYSILLWSLKCCVKQTWTGSTISTNESAWSLMVTGNQCRVWSGPKFAKLSQRLLKRKTWQIVQNLIELSVKSLKEGWNRRFDHSLRKLSIKSSLAHCVLKPILKDGCKFWNLRVFPLLKFFENFRT